MKKIYFVFALFAAGCATFNSTAAYFTDESNVQHTIHFSRETGIIGSDQRYILFIDNAPQDTLPPVSMIVTQQMHLTKFQNKTIEFRAVYHWRVLYEFVTFECLIDGKLVAASE